MPRPIGLPGLVIDRYDDVAVLQANTAGMDRLTPLIVEALTGLLPLRAVVARNDSAARRQEGLAESVALLFGTDATRRGGGGRRAVSDRSAGRAEDRLVLRPAAEPRSRRGAGEGRARAGRVLPCRRVRPALRRGRRTRGDAGGQQRAGPGAGRAGGGAERRCAIACKSGATMRSMRWRHWPANGSTSWCAIRRPSPARARTRRPDCAPTARMARLAAPLVAPGGFLFVASCSHHAPLEAWSAQIAFGLHRARREGRILFTGGAGPDHPVHPHLPETAYLKTQLIQMLSDDRNTMHPSRANNPLFGPNRFKLGVFSANCDGGLTMSLAPERWRADWDDIVAMTRIADEAGTGIHSAGGEVARLPGQGQHLRPFVRDADAWRGTRRADASASRSSPPCMCRWSRRRSAPRRSPPSTTSRTAAPASTSSAAGTRRSSTCTASRSTRTAATSMDWNGSASGRACCKAGRSSTGTASSFI